MSHLGRIKSECHLLVVCLIGFYFDFVAHETKSDNVTILINFFFIHFMQTRLIIDLFLLVRPLSCINEQPNTEKRDYANYSDKSVQNYVWTSHPGHYLYSKWYILNITFYCFSIEVNNLSFFFQFYVYKICSAFIFYWLRLFL